MRKGPREGLRERFLELKAHGGAKVAVLVPKRRVALAGP